MYEHLLKDRWQLSENWQLLERVESRTVYHKMTFCLSLLLSALSSSSSRSSDGNSSLLDEGGSALQVPQATVQLAGYGSVVWLESLSEWLVDRAGLQQMFCCLTASTVRALLCNGWCGLEYRLGLWRAELCSCGFWKLMWGWNSWLVVRWARCPAWCSVVGSILLWGEFFR